MRRSPLWERIETGNDSVLLPLREWARQHPDQMSKLPAVTHVAKLHSAVTTSRLLREPPVIGGTWRLEIELEGGRRLVRYLRTWGYVAYAWGPTIRDGNDAASQIYGYNLDYFLSPREDTWGGWTRTPMHVQVVADRAEPRWNFTIALEELRLLAGEAPEILELIRRRPPQGTTPRRVFPGAVVRRPNGRMEMSLAWDLNGDGRDEIAMTGHRVWTAMYKRLEDSKWVKQK